MEKKTRRRRREEIDNGRRRVKEGSKVESVQETRSKAE